MDNPEIRRRARRFLGEFGPGAASSEGLKAAIEKMGYTLVPFRPEGSSEAAETVIRTLGLEGMISGSKAFTFANSSYRFVFFHEGLSDRELRQVLSHEVGHIRCDHLKHAPVLGKDVEEELEANEFARYLIRRSERVLWLRRHRKLFATCLVLVILAACGLVWYHNRPKQTVETRSLPVDGVAYYGEYYVTRTGTKFHTKDCGWVTNVKRADGVRRLTVDDFQSGKYSPCSYCLPDFEPED